MTQRVISPPGSEGMYGDGRYAAANPTWHAEHSQWKAEQILQALKSVPNIRTIAEVGCGAGDILCHLQRQLPETSFSGYEMSTDAFSLCSPKHNKSLHFEFTDLTKSSAYFDVLLVIDVIEHVENVFGFLRDLKRRAAYKVFHIPLDMNCNAMCRGIVMGNRRGVGHLHYFMRETALATLVDCGYLVEDWFYTPTLDLGPKRASNRVRRAMFSVFPDAAVLLAGGYSLMVVAR